MIPKPNTVSIVFYVSDIVRTEAFYRDTLGVEIERREGMEPFWLVGKAGGMEIIFFQMEAVRGSTPALIFDISSEGGIDDVVAALVEKGVTIVTPVSEAPGGWSADFLDPDGFGLGLYQSDDKPRSLKRK